MRRAPEEIATPQQRIRVEVDDGQAPVELMGSLRCRIRRPPGDRVHRPGDPIGHDPEAELGDGGQPGTDGSERSEAADDGRATHPDSPSIGTDSSADPVGSAEVTDA
jgi:hypothetical protein